MPAVIWPAPPSYATAGRSSPSAASIPILAPSHKRRIFSLGCRRNDGARPMLKRFKRPIAATVLSAALLAAWALSIVTSGTGAARDARDYGGVYVTTFSEPHLAQAF